MYYQPSLVVPEILVTAETGVGGWQVQEQPGRMKRERRQLTGNALPSMHEAPGSVRVHLCVHLCVAHFFSLFKEHTVGSSAVPSHLP